MGAPPPQASTTPTSKNPGASSSASRLADKGVTISPDDLTFYVGTRPWHQSLGAEAKVLFFLAYSRALLFLNQDLGNECAYPGLLMLDNPFQQGISASLIRDAVSELARVAQITGAQIIGAQAAPVTYNSTLINEINMPRTYLGESGEG